MEPDERAKLAVPAVWVQAVEYAIREAVAERDREWVEACSRKTREEPSHLEHSCKSPYEFFDAAYNAGQYQSQGVYIDFINEKIAQETERCALVAAEWPTKDSPIIVADEIADAIRERGES